MKTHRKILISCLMTLHSFRCAYLLCLDSSAVPVTLPFLCWPPQARPHATTCSLLQVVAAQLFQHPFISGNREWQKELTPSFHTKEKKFRGGDYLVLAQVTLSFCKTAHGPPGTTRWPELAKGRVTRQLAPAWRSSAPQKPPAGTAHHVCRMRNTKLLAPVRLSTAHQRDMPCLIGHSRLQASGLRAHISGVLTLNDVFCPKTCLFLCAIGFHILMPLIDLFIILFFCHDLKQHLLILYFIITLLSGELLKTNCWENL